MDASTAARWLAIAGVVLVVTAGVVWLAGRLGDGQVPGNVSVSVGGVRIHLLLGLSLVLSVVGTIVLSLLARR